jgi:hypothetical protein
MRIPSHAAFPVPVGHAHHAHALDRMLSRRQFMSAAALATGATLTAGVWMPALATPSADPRPIPGGIQPFGPGTEIFHLFLPESGSEPSSITDFKGNVGICNIQGTGRSADGRPWLYDTDLRFMQGTFVGKDDRKHTGTFGLV